MKDLNAPLDPVAASCLLQWAPMWPARADGLLSGSSDEAPCRVEGQGRALDDQ